MTIQTKYIFIIILFSFFVSIFISFNYVNKYDKLNSDLDRHRMIKDNIVGDTYTDLRVIGSFSKNYQYRNMFSYIITLSYRKANPT